jgi:hypothetical protein
MAEAPSLDEVRLREIYRRHAAAPDLPRGVRRFRSIEALNEERGDPYRRSQ